MKIIEKNKAKITKTKHFKACVEHKIFSNIT
jgi:hypothetical protein